MSGRDRTRSLAAQLGERDLAILASLREFRLMSGAQLRRLHFPGGHPVTQARKTRAALKRLSDLGVTVRLSRRVGGIRAGSEGFVIGLSGWGQAVLDADSPAPRRHRRVSDTKPAFQTHVLTVSELYLQLVEHSRTDRGELLDFAGEPRGWRRYGGLGGQVVILKPDAFVRLGVGAYELAAFIEVDLDTESLPTITRKLGVYVDYWRTGQEQHVHGVFPRVWWLVPSTRRLQAIQHAVRHLPHETHALFAVCLTSEAARLLTQLPAQGGAS